MVPIQFSGLDRLEADVQALLVEAPALLQAANERLARYLEDEEQEGEAVSPSSTMLEKMAIEEADRLAGTIADRLQGV